MTHHMLITDDDPCLLAMYRKLFGRLDNLAIDYAATPDACKDLLATKKYDVALLDISLGDECIDGFGLLSLIRDASPETDVLMMSSMDGGETVTRCLQLGAKTFASKNRDFASHLPRQVQALLARRAVGALAAV